MAPHRTDRGTRPFRRSSRAGRSNVVVVFAVAIVLNMSTRVLANDDGTWSPITAPPNLPRPPQAPASVYDAATDRILVYGGYFDGSQNTDLFAIQRVNGQWIWSLVPVDGTHPPFYEGVSMILDPVRRRLVVFGGKPPGSNTPTNTVWMLDLDSPTSWVQATPSGTAPPPRSGHSAIYDPNGDRMIVYGGIHKNHSPETYNDVWALSLGNPLWWSQLYVGTTSSVQVPPIYGHGAVYDPIRARMVVFGGLTSPGGLYYNDVWSLSLTGPMAWSLLTPTGVLPAPRFGAGVVYDADLDALEVFGGQGTSGLYDDTWRLPLSGGAWQEIPAGGSLPQPRDFPVAQWIDSRSEFVLLGGYSGIFFMPSGELWRLPATTVTSWQPDTLVESDTTGIYVPFGPPGAARVVDAVLDAPRRRIVVFGSPVSSPMNDVWAFELDSRTWVNITPAGPAPAARTSANVVYDPFGERMIVMYGMSAANPSQMLDDVWALSLGDSSGWTQFPVTGMTPRIGAALAFDPARNRVVIWGGKDENGLLYGDTWQLVLTYGVPFLQQYFPYGQAPAPRVWAAAAYDPLFDRILIAGGLVAADDARSNSWGGVNLYAIDEPERVWQYLGTIEGGMERGAFIVDPVGSRAVWFSGATWDVGTLYYPLASGPWTRVQPTGTSPHGVVHASAVYDTVTDAMIVAGGINVDNPYYVTEPNHEIWSLQWNRLPTAAGERPRSARAGAPYPNPFNPRTVVPFTLTRAGRVRVDVFDVAGRRVTTLLHGSLGAGEHRIGWNGTDARGRAVASGVYFCRIVAPGLRATRKLVLVE